MHQFGSDAWADTERDSRATNGYARPHCDSSAHRHAHTADQYLTSDRYTHGGTTYRNAHTTNGDAWAGDGHGVRGGL